MTQVDQYIAPLMAFFLPALSTGGAERVMMALSQEIAKHGYRCDLIAAQAGGKWESNLPIGVRYISLNCSKPLYAVPRLVKYLRRERPTAIISSVLAANFASLLSCALARTPTRSIVREAYPAGEDAISTSLLTTVGNKLALRVLYRQANAIIALSGDLALHIREVAHVPAHKVHIIPNPRIPANNLVSELETMDCYANPMIFACGRLEPQKDFETLLRAFSIVRAQRPAHLVIAGKGSQERVLVELSEKLGIDDDLTLVGYQPNPQAWMRKAKVFVSSANREGFPNVLLEALDCGCQVISTNSSDTVPEILGDGRFGSIVPVGDAHALAASINSALDGSAPYPPATEHLKAYDLAIIAERYLTLMRDESSQ